MAAVRDSYEVDSYLDTYDGKFLAGSKTGGKSMLGRRSILAHAVHCQDSELARMAETGTSIAHCPTSQLFLGSGTMPWRRTVGAGVTVAMGSDVGAGDEWMIPRVLNDSFKVHISETGSSGISLDPATLLFTGTLAGARALDIDSRTGNLDVGKEADFLVVDPGLQPSFENLMAQSVRADDADKATDQTLFTLIMAMREEAIAKVFVKGREILP